MKIKVPKLTKSKSIALFVILLCAVAWCCLIFKLSSMTSETSNDHSSSLVEQGISQILTLTNAYEITNSHPDPENLAKATRLINAPLRKVIHASVYLVLAILLITIGVVIFEHRHYFLLSLSVLILCSIFALLDEYHQTFVDGRTGQFFDVFIDTLGAAIGLLVAATYQLAWRLGRRSLQRSNS